MIDARNFKRQFVAIQPERIRDLINAGVTVAEPNHFRVRKTPRKVGHSREHGVRDLEIPCVRTNLEHILQHIFEESHLREVDPEGFVVHHVQASAEAIPVILRNCPTFAQQVVVADKRGVHDEIGASERVSAVDRCSRPDIDAHFARISGAEKIDALEPVGIDVHQRDRAAAQARGQTKIPDQAE